MTEEFKKEVFLENERKRKETEGRPSKNCTPIGVQNSRENTDVRNRSETWTDSQIAQKAGVGTGSVARYNKIMNSDDEELKEQVKTGQVTVNIAKYDVVMKSDNEPKLYA